MFYVLHSQIIRDHVKVAESKKSLRFVIKLFLRFVLGLRRTDVQSRSVPAHWLHAAASGGTTGGASQQTSTPTAKMFS